MRIYPQVRCMLHCLISALASALAEEGEYGETIQLLRYAGRGTRRVNKPVATDPSEMSQVVLIPSLGAVNSAV